MGEGALVLKEANRKHLQGPLTWGGINLISALPQRTSARMGWDGVVRAVSVRADSNRYRLKR